MQDPNARDIFTIINPVFFCENVSEESRTEPDKINLEFPGLVTRIYLLSRISRCVSKGGWDEWSCQCDSLSVSLPDFANQDAPVPELQFVRWVNLDHATPEAK